MISRRRFLRTAPAAWAAWICLERARGAESAAPASGAQPQAPRIGRSTREIDIRTLMPGSIRPASRAAARILQFTDLHLFRTTAADDEKTLADCRKMVDRHKPDLVVVSGDLWQDNPEGKGHGYLEAAVRSFSSWGVPWTMCWGNHDLVDDYQRAHDLLQGAERSAYRGAATHGDYRIEVQTDASAEPALDLFFLNTDDQGMGPWQVRAFSQMAAHCQGARSKTAPSLVFFHVPLRDYESRLRPASFRGVKLEPVTPYKEDGGAFPALLAARTVRACFCGHNHTNDYVVQAEGIDLNYGRSTGYAGYGSDVLRKGGKSIEVDLASGAYRQTTVFGDGSKTIAMTGARSEGAVPA